MPDAPLSLFISYSRTDSEFVDRLEADLKAHGFFVWVDRRKMEPGQEFMDELQKAIDRCQVLLVVLSPEAVESSYVKTEYRYALSEDKLVMPLYWRTTKVPADLRNKHRVDFQSSYDQGLAELLNALSHLELAALPPDTDLNQLYRQGLAAKIKGDLEHAANLWQQVLARDPSYANGTLATEMEGLQAELQLIRVRSLHEQAEQAHSTGEWGKEISAWQALLEMEPKDAQISERISVAQENQKYIYLYVRAQEFAKAKNVAELKTQLEHLWQKAPYYGDPDGLAKRAGLKAPPSFREAMIAKRRMEAAEAEVRRKKEQAEQHKQQRAEQTEQRKKQRREFVSFSSWGEPQVGAVWFSAFCLLISIGAIVGMFSQTWLWAIGATTAIALISFIFGYRKALRLVDITIILLISAGLVFGITLLLATNLYDQPHVSHLWFNAVRVLTLKHQIIFGACIGGGIGLLCGLITLDDFETYAVSCYTSLGIIAALVVWLILAILGSIFDWGFGFGYGWVFTLLVGLPLPLFGMTGLFASIFICIRATKSPEYIHRQVEAGKARHEELKARIASKTAR